MIGQTFAHYRIVEKIGAGGMGEVYRAHDEKLDRDVALKVLLASALRDETARARLLREARTASALNHPHICTIYEVGEADGQAYIAMEYVAGQPLSALIPSDGLPVETAVRYGVQIAAALAHAHERGVIHRDLKSANVVITAEGEPKVLDFGLAKRLEGRELSEVTTQSQASLTQPGAVMGTLPYMAPEQLRGQGADARSDVWALGVMLYETLTGKRPFQGETGYELSSAILNQVPAPLPSQLPIELQLVIERCLEKEPGRRYRRAGEVRAALEAVQAGTAVVPWAVWGRKLARRRFLATAGALAALVAVLVGLNVGGLRERLLGGVAPGQITSLAVLPLDNLMGDAEQDYFVEGMHEALITTLAKIGALTVISRTSAMRYKDTDKPLPQIARELGVDAVIEGSVLRAGNQVRITAQLIEAATDRHLWAESYERDLRDILALQSEVARTIAREIQIAVTPAEETRLAATRPVNPEAYEAYLKGRYHQDKFTEEDLRKAVEYFHQARELDPNYALAYAGLAGAYFGQAERGEGPVARAKAAARKALELDENLPEAHAEMGWILQAFDWDWSGAEKEFKRALELNPGHADTLLNYGYLLSGNGRHDEAIAVMKRAQRIDPLRPMINLNLGMRYYYARQYDNAIEQLLKTLDLEPDYTVATYYLHLPYLQKGMYEEAIAALMEAFRKWGRDPATSPVLAYAYAVSGQEEEARKMLANLTLEGFEGNILPMVWLHLALDEKEKAFEWLEMGYEKRYPTMGWLKVDPMLDSLRADPRFHSLLRPMNFPG